MVNKLKYWFQKTGWKVVIAVVTAAAICLYLYKLVKPENKMTQAADQIIEKAQVQAEIATIKGELEKDKIGAVKKIFQTKLNKNKEIVDTKERLSDLIRLRESLDL
jgi:predicted negative regulator of RcsB-dependent stress response